MQQLFRLLNSCYTWVFAGKFLQSFYKKTSRNLENAETWETCGSKRHTVTPLMAISGLWFGWGHHGMDTSPSFPTLRQSFRKPTACPCLVFEIENRRHLFEISVFFFKEENWCKFMLLFVFDGVSLYPSTAKSTSSGNRIPWAGPAGSTASAPEGQKMPEGIPNRSKAPSKHTKKERKWKEMAMKAISDFLLLSRKTISLETDLSSGCLHA